jgi:hypothetical protein
MSSPPLIGQMPAQAAGSSVTGSSLPQALNQCCQRLNYELRLCNLVNPVVVSTAACNGGLGGGPVHDGSPHTPHPRSRTFGYSVYFPEDFKFQLGGKLPGFYGGDSDAESIGCSGGRRSEKCFSARLMWRTDGAGELYTYLPPADIPRFSANKAICKVKPVSDCNPTYGASVGRGSFSFAAGKRTYVSQRVRLNDVNQANGEIELFADGKSVVNVSGLILRDSGDGRIRGLQMQTFFGGSTEDFASPQTQSAYFSDMSVAITEHL